MDKIRKGDEVIVIAGRDKGKRGTVTARVNDQQLLVDGVNVVKKHQLSAIQSGAWGELGSAIGKEVIDRRVGRSGDAFGLKSQLASAGVDLVKNGMFLRPLDRGMEYEADRLGVAIAARAGYDPYGLVAVLQMLAQVKPDEAGTSLIFSTHPPAAERLAELEKAVAALDRYASQPQVEGRFRQTVGAR